MSAVHQMIAPSMGMLGLDGENLVDVD